MRVMQNKDDSYTAHVSAPWLKQSSYSVTRMGAPGRAIIAAYGGTGIAPKNFTRVLICLYNEG